MMKLVSSFATRGGPPAWGWGEGLIDSHRKRSACYEMLHVSEHSGSLKSGEFRDYPSD
jgi:hypothetical protein